jgi:hypothetical protein
MKIPGPVRGRPAPRVAPAPAPVRSQAVLSKKPIMVAPPARGNTERWDPSQNPDGLPQTRDRGEIKNRGPVVISANELKLPSGAALDALFKTTL